MQQIILYYKFIPIDNPELVRLWQKALCEKLGLKGRILISSHGINGTLGGEVDSLKAYIRESKSFDAFKTTTYKWSDGTAEDFPRLSVKVRSEIVAFNASKELVVDEGGVVGGGTHLKPEQVHELIERYGDDVVFFDGRNAYEAEIGRFKNAIIPDTNTTHDFIPELESGKYDWLKDKHVVTYCTGGVRCEILSPIMKNRGFKNVYQLDGGIVRYGEKYGDDGLWEGSLYVFDRRMEMKFSDHTAIISNCNYCGNPTSNYEDIDLPNNKEALVLVCEECKDKDIVVGLRK